MQEHIKKRIDSIIANIEQLPSIPEVASKIINMVNNPNVSFKAVADEIIKDQAMTTNILKLCNSAYFSKGKEITSIERAIVTLGIKEVKDIIMVLVAKPVLDKGIIGYDLAKGEMWKQGLLVASIAKKIALLKKRKDIADEVFTGGLIHNVGKIVTAMFVQSTLKEILAEVETKQITFSEAEKVVMGYKHQEIAEQILKKWQFPPVLQAMVRYYDEVENSPKEFLVQTSIIHIATSLSLMAGIGIGSDGLYYSISPIAVSTLKLTESEMENLFGTIPETMQEIKDLL